MTACGERGALEMIRDYTLATQPFDQVLANAVQARRRNDAETAFDDRGIYRRQATKANHGARLQSCCGEIWVCWRDHFIEIRHFLVAARGNKRQKHVGVPSGGDRNDQRRTKLACRQVSFGKTHEYQIARFHRR